ncbi:head-tail connector protein [Consotaella aegiceratis]|uniref:head-tail connector protein n=1 Tax=Consotaella aegiceratis TaxID=3097961 RepID=UPI002F3F59D2
MTIVDLGTDLDEPVSLAVAKGWCRIENTDEDDLVVALIRAARQAIEAATGLVLVRRGFRLYVDPVPSTGWIEIARQPLVAVTSLVAYDGSGEPVSFGLDEVVIGRALGVEALRLSPAVRAAATNGVEVEFEAGFAAGTVPEPLCLALKQIVATSYEVRSAVHPAAQPAIVPASAAALIASYRQVRL